MNRSVTNFFFDGEMFAKIDLEDSYVLTLWGTSQTYLSWAATCRTVTERCFTTKQCKLNKQPHSWRY